VFKLFEFIIIIGAFLCATYTDLKSAIVPNILTFSMIIGGIVWAAIIGNIAGIGFAVFIFIIGFIVNKFGQFGGGDVKFLTGLALWNPIYFSNFEFYLIMFIVSGITAIVFTIGIKGYEQLSEKKLIENGVIKFIPFLFVGYVLTAVSFL